MVLAWRWGCAARRQVVEAWVRCLCGEARAGGSLPSLNLLFSSFYEFAGYGLKAQLSYILGLLYRCSHGL